MNEKEFNSVIDMKKEIRKKRAEAIAEKALVVAEGVGLLAGGMAAFIVGITGTAKVVDKLCDGYDEDNPMGLRRTLVATGTAIVGCTATSLGTGWLIDKGIETLEELDEIEIPEDKSVEELANEQKKKDSYDPDDRVIFNGAIYRED